MLLIVSRLIINEDVSGKIINYVIEKIEKSDKFHDSCWRRL